MRKISVAAATLFALVFGISALTANAQTKKIGMAKAKAIALKQASGKIQSSELENENGKMIYSFDIRNNKGTMTEVNIEAYTGAVVAVSEENPKKEANEKKQEKMEKKTTSRKH
ncbi:MAG: PepSY domain-containing protein [Pyrinomonadaceae bacterium]